MPPAIHPYDDHIEFVSRQALKKKGRVVEVLERLRMVGPNKAGSRGSYSIYLINEAA